VKPLSSILGIYVLVLIVPLFSGNIQEKNINVVETNTIATNSIVYIEEETPIMIGDETKEEVIEKLNKVLKHELKNNGEILVEKALAYEVDPYIAVAIILHETGCNSGKCSNLVRACNNVGGQKTSSQNKCGNGSYAKFPSIEIGIDKFFSNLSRNYIQKGLTTPELMNKKYAESTTWASKINYYVNWLKK